MTGRVLAYANPPTSPFGFLGAPPVGALVADFFPPEIASALRAALRGPNESAEATFTIDDPRSGRRAGRVTVEAAEGDALVLLEADADVPAPRRDVFALLVAKGGDAPRGVSGDVSASVRDLVRSAAAATASVVADSDLSQRVPQMRAKLGESGPSLPLSPVVPSATPEPLRTALAAEGIGAYVRVPFTVAGEPYVLHALAPTAQRVGQAVRQQFVAQAISAVARLQSPGNSQDAPTTPAATRIEATVSVVDERPRRHTLPYAPLASTAVAPVAFSEGAAGDTTESLAAAQRPSGVLPRPTAITVALMIGECRDLPATLEAWDWVVVRVRDGAAAAAIAQQLRFDLCLIGDAPSGMLGRLSRAELDELESALRARAAEIPIWYVGNSDGKLPGVPFRDDADILAFAGGLPNVRAAR
jgi:hypothetical protein